jgi:hypothetical protein
MMHDQCCPSVAYKSEGALDARKAPQQNPTVVVSVIVTPSSGHERRDAHAQWSGGY